ncbi:hypothetical protein HMPREF9420_1636 [Segatella salivae DSM 15606]|uniref:Uncharacterized protein n=1 Tax=Segatella salivae DSM 15606 TaxID=888832 RepID=E6MQ68_9BACT|nr:hypothetical protein HMPREF9420_1636 [Segatella salivae DSM 15606]
MGGEKAKNPARNGSGHSFVSLLPLCFFTLFFSCYSLIIITFAGNFEGVGVKYR